MLSGIGHADHLRELGIIVMVDSPGVGANLSDHPLLPAIPPTAHHAGSEEPADAHGEASRCAATAGSPQLLRLSGIGHAAHLRELGIIVMGDSPGVGANLSDRPVVPAMWRTPKVPALWEKSSTKNLFRWQLRHSGPFTSNIAESGGFSRTRPSLSAPDLQWHALPTPFLNQGLGDPQT